MKYPAKPAKAEAPILDVIANRWSPVIFDAAPLSPEQIASLFEAARFAASSYNEQPWRYVYAGKKDTGREALESLLAEGNTWAKNAGLLILSFTRKEFLKNGKPNRHYFHDLGAASATLTLQATSMGLISHQMAGFAVDKANGVLAVPDDFEPGSMIAIGYAGDPANFPEEMQLRDESPRVRNPRETFAFRGTFGSV